VEFLRADQMKEYELHLQTVEARNSVATRVAESADVVTQDNGNLSPPINIKDLARQKIAEAEAAIAAAEYSAIQAMQGERFSPHRIPPWAVAPPANASAINSTVDLKATPNSTIIPQVISPKHPGAMESFTSSLKKHETHLRALQASATPPLQLRLISHPQTDLVPVASAHRKELAAKSAPDFRNPATSLPPWAHPSPLPTFKAYISGVEVSGR
jgi:hypothetical protein